MSQLRREASQIFDIALAASGEDCDVMLTVDHAGGIRILESAGWSLAGLQAHYGAASAYQIRRADGRVRIEASGGGQRCFVEATGQDPRRAARPRLILSDRPLYRVERPYLAPGFGTLQK